MNAVINVIFERRAVRKYKDSMVPKDFIEQILDAGRMAPSAMNKQPWKFYILLDKEDIHRASKEIVKVGLKKISDQSIKELAKTIVAGISQLAHGIDFSKIKDPVFYGAPVVIFITAPKDNEWAALDIGMCAQNMMLAARSLGLDSCPVGFGKFIEQTKEYSKLGLATNEQIHLALIIGYGNESPSLYKREKNNCFYKTLRT